jgi:hypothetical protein
VRRLVQVCMLLGSALLFSSLLASPASAEDVYDELRHCLDSATQGNPTEGANWWNRRSSEEQKYMIELPCEEKYIVAVCVFLYEPDLKGCTNKGVARFRADRHCASQGHEILSEERAACSREYVANFNPVF